MSVWSNKLINLPNYENVEKSKFDTYWPIYRVVLGKRGANSGVTDPLSSADEEKQPATSQELNLSTSQRRIHSAGEMKKMDFLSFISYAKYSICYFYQIGIDNSHCEESIYGCKLHKIL